jgi:putative endonuclease
MSTFYLYILRCADGTLYTGITTDVKRRLKEHQGKTAQAGRAAKRGARYTRARGARKIVHTEKFPTRSAALKREYEIKSWRREKKLALIG